MKMHFAPANRATLTNDEIAASTQRTLVSERIGPSLAKSLSIEPRPLQT
jgi:hypothetical protein